MTNTTACVGEHCLRLRLEIFSGKIGFYTQWSWVWRKGAHIERSAFMRAELLVFKLHLNGEGPICSFFPTTRIWCDRVDQKRAFQVTLVFLESNHDISRRVSRIKTHAVHWHTVSTPYLIMRNVIWIFISAKGKKFHVVNRNLKRKKYEKYKLQLISPLQLFTGNNHCSSRSSCSKTSSIISPRQPNREVDCNRDCKRLGRLSATAFCVRVCCMWTGDGADNWVEDSYIILPLGGREQ